MIRTIEELSLNAWPALQTRLYDGWLLRFANGYTRRSNSVNPLYPSDQLLEEKVTRCERLYRDLQLKVVFKMTPASCPEALDDFLAAQGYRAEAHTSLQVLDLNDASLPSSNEIRESVTEEWFEAFCRLSQLELKHQPTARQLLQSIGSKTGYAAIREGGEIIACGLGVVEGSYVGLFDLVTGTGYRRRGYGLQLVQGMVQWGKAQGARTAYLQVMRNNEPALALYAKLGFREQYCYWYRVKA